jgi:hypothetical protein
MPLFRSKKQEQPEPHHGAPPQVPGGPPGQVPDGPPGRPAAEPPRSPSAGWADIEAVRAEWPRPRLDPEADLRAWREGMQLYEGSDDYQSMMRCAFMLSAALAHSLYGEGILRGNDLPDTVHRVLYSALCAPPDRQTFADDAQRAARLALTVIRENGWQPASMGGQGLFDKFIMDTGNYMLLCAAVGPGGGLPGNLKAFLAVPPHPAL